MAVKHNFTANSINKVGSFHLYIDLFKFCLQCQESSTNGILMHDLKLGSIEHVSLALKSAMPFVELS